MQDSRRTKIICSVNENCSNYNLMKDMLNAGCNAFSYIISYYEVLIWLIQKIKNLQSNQIHLGVNQSRSRIQRFLLIQYQEDKLLEWDFCRNLRQQQMQLRFYCKQGSFVYLTSDQHNIGNNQFIPIDSNEFLEKLSINDKLAIDYGHVILQLIDVQLFDNLYEKIGIDKICLLSGVKIYVCQCLKTGAVKSYKPISLFVENKVPIEEFKLDEVQEITLTEQDLQDIDYAAECGFDSITLSRVTSPVEITTVKQRLDEKYPFIQVYARITEKLREDQLMDILSESDGCFIARSYIAMTQPVEDVVKYQTDIIKKCRKLFKPVHFLLYKVFIQTFILESMSVQLKPSFADMGDISNIVKQYIDGILLSGETSFGSHPILVVQTLNQMCQKIEKRKLNELLEHPEQRDQCQINFKGYPIPSAIAQSCVEMAYTLSAKAIIMLTRTISTTLKLSKLRASCQVISISDNQSICRCLNYINNVQSVQVIGFENQEQIVQECLSRAIDTKLLNPKDCIIIITGAQTSNKEWHINQIKVTCV